MHAPFLTIGLVLLLGLLIWAGLNFLMRNQIDSLHGRLALRDDEIADYKRKLSGATPDEAKAEIDALKEAIAKLQPKKFSEESMAILASRARAVPGAVWVTFDVAYQAGQGLSTQLLEALSSAGWEATGGSVMGPSFRPKEGIAISLRPLSERTPAEIALCASFDAAGIRYAEAERFIAPFDRRRPSERDRIQVTITKSEE